MDNNRQVFIKMASTIYNYTFTGFGTQVTLDDEQTICTGATVNFGQKIINSQGSFYGGVSYSDETLQANGPPRMDVPQITVDLSFQMTVSLLEKFLQLLEDRKTKIKVQIKGTGGTLTLSYCYWNKISLQVQQNSLMTGSVSFNVIQEYDTVYDYVMFARNSESMNEDNFGLYGVNFNCHVIPYYATAVKLNGYAIQFDGLGDPTSSIGEPRTAATGGTNFIPMAWSLDVSQQISTKTFCKFDSKSAYNGVINLATIPSYIAFGIISCNLNITNLVDAKNGVQLSKLKPYIGIKNRKLSSTDYIEICYLGESMTEEKLFKLNFLQLVSATPNYTDTSNYMSFQLNYQANKITVF